MRVEDGQGPEDLIIHRLHHELAIVQAKPGNVFCR